MRAAIDIGGTFTDVLLYDEAHDRLWTAKVHSTPQAPSEAFIHGLKRVLTEADSQVQEVDALLHGTTLVTNSLLEGKTAKVGLLVTQGFRDVLEIGRQVRPKLYDLSADRLTPLVPRQRVAEVQERVSANGEVLIPLDEEQARTQIEALANLGAESLAVVLLFSFLHPEHEAQVLSLAQNYFPQNLIFLSSQISPEFREFERTSTTVVAAGVAPHTVTYIEDLLNELRAAGWMNREFSLMHSGGGLIPARQAVERPHTLIESGPAAGVIAAANLARSLDVEYAITFDMGGTTAKASLLLDGKPRYTTEYEVGGELHQAGRALGSGYPVRFPMIDVAECGAGAGSIAWVDSGGHLKVGPQSAGAHPGPVCYGRGGSLPTVTDAYLTLGILSAKSFLGGEMLLDKEMAMGAIETYVAKPLGLDIMEAADSILEIANADMLRILRLVSVQRGYDPRDFTLVAYGGAGPLHATALAERMALRQAIIPRYPALFSALGLLQADISADFVLTVMLHLESESLLEIQAALGKLESQAEDWFRKTSAPDESRQLNVSADLRYAHQNYELNIDLPHDDLTAKGLEQVIETYHDTHEKTYGYSSPREVIQIVNLRLQAVHKLVKPGSQNLEPVSGTVRQPMPVDQQIVWLDGEWHQYDVHRREDLLAGHKLIGPAIVQERETTTLLTKGWELMVDDWGYLILERR